MPVLGFFIWSLLTILNLGILAKDIRQAGAKSYFKSHAWGPHEVLVCTFCVVSLLLQALLFSTATSLAAAPQQLALLSSYPTNPLVNFHFLTTVAGAVESVACVLVFTRSLKFVGDIPIIGLQLSAFLDAAAAAAKHVVSALILFTLTTLGFASAACAAFGTALRQWSTVWECMRTLLTVLFGR